jgi:hypothetical protein
MMGEFGGNAGLLSAWFDVDAGEWDYEITMCPAGVQHIWWAVHVLALVTLIVSLLWVVLRLVGPAEVSTKDGVQKNSSPIKKGQSHAEKIPKQEKTTE